MFHAKERFRELGSNLLVIATYVGCFMYIITCALQLR